MTKEHIILDQKSIGVSQYFLVSLKEKMVSDMRMNWRNVEFQPNMETSRPDGIAGLAENKVEEKKCS